MDIVLIEVILMNIKKEEALPMQTSSQSMIILTSYYDY